MTREKVDWGVLERFYEQILILRQNSAITKFRKDALHDFLLERIGKPAPGHGRIPGPAEYVKLFFRHKLRREIDGFRKRKRRIERLQRVRVNEVSEYESRPSLASTDPERVEETKSVTSFAEGLSGPDAEVVDAVIARGQSIAQVACQLRIHRTTVERRLERGLRALKGRFRSSDGLTQN